MNAPSQATLLDEFRAGEPDSRTTIILVDDLYFDVMDPSTWSFNVRTIARSLSNLCRFNGHIENFYSVAEHSVRVCKMLAQWEANPWQVFLGLHHDDIESIIGDIPSPQKRLLSVAGEPIAELEKAMEYSFFNTFNFDMSTFDEDWEIVKKADLAIYLEERRERPNLGMGLLPNDAFKQYLVHHNVLARQLGLPEESITA